MKWLGVVLLILTGTGIGLWGRFRLLRRVRVLRRTIAFINRLSDRIRCTAAPVDELLRGKESCSETDGELRAEWAREIDRHGAEQGFTQEDCRILHTFVDGIGKSDIAGEIRFCAECCEALRIQLDSAKEILDTRGRSQVTLGVCGGLLTALLLW